MPLAAQPGDFLSCDPPTSVRLKAKLRREDLEGFAEPHVDESRTTTCVDQQIVVLRFEGQQVPPQPVRNALEEPIGVRVVCRRRECGGARSGHTTMPAMTSWTAATER